MGRLTSICLSIPSSDVLNHVFPVPIGASPIKPPERNRSADCVRASEVDEMLFPPVVFHIE